MSGAVIYKSADDFVSHRDYLKYMYGNVPGLIVRGVISSSKQDGKKDASGYTESFNFFDRLVYQNRYSGVTNVYTSMNTFLTKRDKYNSRSGRKVENLKRLNALYLDLDCYKMGLSQKEVLDELEANYFDKRIPVPTFVINSGRGIYLIWKINEDRNALPRWKTVINYLFEQCKCFNADPKAMDAARILRVPNSINGHNGEPVTILRFNDVKYTLYGLIKKYNIKAKPSNKKAKKDVTYPYGQATERQRKVAEWQAANFGVALPDFNDYNATFNFIRENSERQQKINKVERAVTKNKSMSATLDGRVSDLFTLFSMRKGDGIGREIALFLCRLWTAERTNDFEYALELTKALNRSFDTPHEEKYVETRTRSAETIIKRGSTYRYSLSNIIRILGITESEQQELKYLRRRTLASIERRKQSNHDAYLRRLQAKGKSTKKDAIRIRREKIACFIIEGKTKEDICSLLQISPRTYDRDKAVIISDGLLEKVKSRLNGPSKNRRKRLAKRTVKNAQGYRSPFFKSYYYRRTHVVRSAYSLSNLYYIYCDMEQLTWDDIFPGGLENRHLDSKNKNNTS